MQAGSSRKMDQAIGSLRVGGELCRVGINGELSGQSWLGVKDPWGLLPVY